MKNTAMSRFAKNVSAILEERELSVTALAELCGIGRPSLSRILNGHEGITLERAEKIAEALEVELSDLISKSPLVVA